MRRRKAGNAPCARCGTVRLPCSAALVMHSEVAKIKPVITIEVSMSTVVVAVAVVVAMVAVSVAVEEAVTISIVQGSVVGVVAALTYQRWSISHNYTVGSIS